MSCLDDDGKGGDEGRRRAPESPISCVMNAALFLSFPSALAAGHRWEVSALAVGRSAGRGLDLSC